MPTLALLANKLIWKCSTSFSHFKKTCKQHDSCSYSQKNVRVCLRWDASPRKFLLAVARQSHHHLFVDFRYLTIAYSVFLEGITSDKYPGKLNSMARVGTAQAWEECNGLI